MPYTGAQIVFIYNSKYLNGSAIQSMAELVSWVQSHPGKFTYAQPWGTDGVTYDYTGSAFIRHFLYEFCGPDPSQCSYKQYLGPFNYALYNSTVLYAFQQLVAMEPYLYGYVEGVAYQYPVTQDDVDLLFGSEDIWIVRFMY